MHSCTHISTSPKSATSKSILERVVGTESRRPTKEQGIAKKMLFAAVDESKIAAQAVIPI